MALIKDLILNSGTIVSNAYFKVIRADIRNQGTSMVAEIVVAVYMDKAWADADNPPIMNFLYRMEQFDASVDTISAGTQIYGFLKSLSDFTNAVDA